MSNVYFSSAAASDLKDIHDYIFTENPVAADKLLDDLQQSCEGLARYPRIGVSRDDLQPGIRLIVVRKLYVVFYRIIDPEVEIVRIVNGQRDYSKLFDL